MADPAPAAAPARLFLTFHDPRAGRGLQHPFRLAGVRGLRAHDGRVQVVDGWVARHVIGACAAARSAGPTGARPSVVATLQAPEDLILALVSPAVPAFAAPALRLGSLFLALIFHHRVGATGAGQGATSHPSRSQPAAALCLTFISVAFFLRRAGT